MDGLVDAPFAAVVVAVAVHGRVLLVDPRRSVESGGRGWRAEGHFSFQVSFGGETFGARRKCRIADLQRRTHG